MKNGFEELRIDNTGITALELFKLARETQLKVYEKACHRWDVAMQNNFKNKDIYWNQYKVEGRKLDYIEYMIKQLESEDK